MITMDRLETFGDPSADRDLARSEDAVEDLFVETAAIKRFLGPGSTQHVIVGSKGSGKSLLLFKKAVLTTRNPSVIVSPNLPLRAYTPEVGFAGAEDWIFFFRDLFDEKGRPARESWTRLWLWALLATVLHSWRRYLEHGSREDDSLHSGLTELLEPTPADNPFLLISEYIEGIATGIRKIKGRPILPEVRPLRNFLVDHVQDLPPAYVFLDNQDDLFPEYPDFWKAMGLGCFLAIQKLHYISNHRAHVYLTLRPEMEWELRKAESWSQTQADIFNLRWSDEELLEILEARARRLDPKYLASPELVDDDPMGAFWGKSLFDPSSRKFVLRVPSVEKSPESKVTQPINDHLLRHTLRRPREMIILGNAIIDSRWNKQNVGVPQDVLIRDTIDDTAADVIARSYVEEVRHRWPWGDPPAKALRDFVTTNVQKNLLSAGEVKRIEKAYAESMGLSEEEVYPFRQLASLGLVGWPAFQASTGRLIQNFLLPGEDDLEALPGGVDWYIVHPIFYAAPFHVRPVPGLLVGPGLPFPKEQEARRLAYYSCFICFGGPDQAFAKRLYDDLREYGVECWLYTEDAKAGDPIWSNIKKKLRKAEKWIVVCSLKSLSREGVVREIEEMVDAGSDRIVPVSLDKHWRASGFKVVSGTRDLKPFLTERTLARFSQRGKLYQQGFEKLLAGLTRR